MIERAIVVSCKGSGLAIDGPLSARLKINVADYLRYRQTHPERRPNIASAPGPKAYVGIVERAGLDGHALLARSTARIASAKRRASRSGWIATVISSGGGEQARKTCAGGGCFTYSDVSTCSLEQRPALDRGASNTDREDNTVLIILDPVAITDEHLFRWGDPPHVRYKIKAVDRVC